MNYFSFSFLFLTRLLFHAGLVIFSFKSYGNISNVEPVNKAQKEREKHVGNCSIKTISIHYNDPESYSIACEGVRRTEKFFKEHFHYTLKEPVKIVLGDISVLTDEEFEKHLTNGEGRFGSYNNNTIFLQPWGILKHKKYFDSFIISKNIYASFVAHELVHHFHRTHIKDLKQGQEEPLESEESEFERSKKYLEAECLAYIVQLETMKDPEKKYLLNAEKKITSDTVSDLVYLLAPDVFFITAHKRYLRTPSVLRSLFYGEKTDIVDSLEMSF